MVRLWAKAARSILAVMDPWNRRDFLRASLGLTSLGLLRRLRGAPIAGPGAGARAASVTWTSGANPQRSTSMRSTRGSADLGYVEGQHVLIERRDAELDFERLPALAAELVGSAGRGHRRQRAAPRSVAASRATSTIPIVTAGTNVVGNGLGEKHGPPRGQHHRRGDERR